MQNEITQKDLLQLLIDQAQHNATREELNRVEDKLASKIENMEDSLKKDISSVEQKVTNLKSTIIITGISSVIALGGLMVGLAQMIK